MSNREVAAGFFRASAVVWSIDVLLAVPQFLNALIRNPYSGNEKAMGAYFLSSQLISIGCSIAVVVFLVRKAGWLASLVFPAEKDVGLSFTAADLQAVLFSAVGLYFLLDGLRHALGSTYVLLTRGRNEGPDALRYLWHDQPENLVRALGGTLLGLLLLSRPRGGRGFWTGIRSSYERRFGLRGSPDEK